MTSLVPGPPWFLSRGRQSSRWISTFNNAENYCIVNTWKTLSFVHSRELTTCESKQSSGMMIEESRTINSCLLCVSWGLFVFMFQTLINPEPQSSSLCLTECMPMSTVALWRWSLSPAEQRLDPSMRRCPSAPLPYCTDTGFLLPWTTWAGPSWRDWDPMPITWLEKQAHLTGRPLKWKLS